MDKGVFSIVFGALLLLFGGWLARELADKMDPSSMGRQLTTEERDRDARRGSMWGHVTGAAALIYGLWNIWRSTLR